MNRLPLTLCLLVLPLVAQATITTDKLAAVCATDNAACTSYTLGGADRFWLVSGKHDACDAKADKKAIAQVTKAAHGKTSFFVTEKPQPGAIALLKYLNANKLQSCALTMNLADLSARCGSQQAADQNICHAYVAGVMDVALAMDQIHHENAAPGTPYQTPFCDAGIPKKAMTDDEVMKTLGEYAKAHAADAAKTPASDAVIDALLEKFPCGKAASPAAPSTAPATVQPKQ